MDEKKRKIKLAICVPYYGTVTARWANHFEKFLIDCMRKYNVSLHKDEGQPVDNVRNRLIQEALKSNPDYIFFMDSDNEVPQNCIKDLIASMQYKNADLVTALYFQKSAPYYPTIKKYRSDMFFTIENPDIGHLIEIDATGMGCCLIKPEVFRKLEKPWFKFHIETEGPNKGKQLSEDLYFCRNVLKAGFKQFCHTGIISNHIGGVISIFEHMAYDDIRLSNENDRESLKADIKDFLHISDKELDVNFQNGPMLIAKEWNDKNPKTDEEILNFYKTTENYLFDQAFWHSTSRRGYDTALYGSCLKRNNNKLKGYRVLDFGCGIGVNAFMLAKGGADVTIADLDCVSLDFARFRFHKHKIPFKKWITDKEDMPPLEKYDLILCNDVFEHISEEHLSPIIDKLNKLKHEKTLIEGEFNFGKTDNHPMHYDFSEGYHKIMEKLYKPVTP